ncbi:MAG: helix-turn-helix domain-containing protein [Reyranella sp.]|nr:helix-turn-helix domain-containing protein [Reyranella sp.]
MSSYDQDRPFVRENPPLQGVSWTEAAYYTRLHGKNFTPPANMRGMSLAEIEAKAREETREAREAEEARQSAARIEAAPKSIERALLDGPKAQASKPAQRGWRQRVRFLNQFRRCGSYREAAARIGVDESTVRRWRAKFPAFRARCDAILAERFREKADDLKLRAGEPRTRPYFFKGKQIGEQVIHDDRTLMFLLKLEDAQRARAEAREERREQRAHEIRLKEMEFEAKKPTPKMHASAAHPVAPVEAESPAEIKDLPAVPADIAPPEVMEVAPPPHLTSPPSGGEEHEGLSSQTPLPPFGGEVG